MSSFEPKDSRLPYVRTNLAYFIARLSHRAEVDRRLMIGECLGIALPENLEDPQEVELLAKLALERTGTHPAVFSGSELPEGSLSYTQEAAFNSGRPVLVHFPTDRLFQLKAGAGSYANPGKLDRISRARRFMLRQSTEVIGRLLDHSKESAEDVKNFILPELASFYWPEETPYETYRARLDYLEKEFGAGNHPKTSAYFLPPGRTAGEEAKDISKRLIEEGSAGVAHQLSYWLTIWRTAILADQKGEQQKKAQVSLSKKFRERGQRSLIREFNGFQGANLTENDVIPLALFGAFDVGNVIRSASSYYKQFELASALGDLSRGKLARFDTFQSRLLLSILESDQPTLADYPVQPLPVSSPEGGEQTATVSPSGERLRAAVMTWRSFLGHAMLSLRPTHWWKAVLEAEHLGHDGYQYVSADAEPRRGGIVYDGEGLRALEDRLAQVTDLLRIHLDTPVTFTREPDPAVPPSECLEINLRHFEIYGCSSSDIILDRLLWEAATRVIDDGLVGRKSNLLQRYAPHYFEDVLSVEWCCYCLDKDYCVGQAQRRMLNAQLIGRMISPEEVKLAQARGAVLANWVRQGIRDPRSPRKRRSPGLPLATDFWEREFNAEDRQLLARMGFVTGTSD